jgi:hypothetical protein
LFSVRRPPLACEIIAEGGINRYWVDLFTKESTS